MLKEGIYYLKESEKLSTYLKKYYNKYHEYPKTKLAFYKFGRLIGRGAFGKVNLGLHILSVRIVAIKSFNKKKIMDNRKKIDDLQYMLTNFIKKEKSEKKKLYIKKKWQQNFNFLQLKTN